MTRTLEQPRPSSRRRRAVPTPRPSRRPTRPARRPRPAETPPAPSVGFELRRVRPHLCWAACGLALFVVTRLWLALGLAQGSEAGERLLASGGALALTVGVLVLGGGAVAELLRDLRRQRAAEEAEAESCRNRAV